MKWNIEPLTGKYYGTRISNDAGDLIVVWTNGSCPVSERELEEGWEEEHGYDHVESQKDYEYAIAIRDALNLKETEYK
jgi:hypothetical protein